MNLSVNTMTPFVEDLIEKTESGLYLWDSIGNESYCLVAGDYSYAIKSQAGAISTAFGPQLTFQFFDKTSCLFEYSQTILTNKDPFAQLIIKLMDVINTKYAEVLRNKAQNAMDALNNKASKS